MFPGFYNGIKGGLIKFCLQIELANCGMPIAEIIKNKGKYYFEFHILCYY